MKYTIIKLFLTIALAYLPFSVNAVGFQQIKVADPGHPHLNVGIWYPTDQPVPTEPNTQFGRALAQNAPITNPNTGLILLSHGFGGWFASHADTAEALANAGFIVAAPSHTGNTWSDMSSTVEQWLLDRPRHISRIIDAMQANTRYKKHINFEKIGVYGFSAGGYTAMTLLGGLLDIDHALQHCQNHPDEFVCAEGAIDSMRESGMQSLPDAAWGGDKRISAAVISAPGFAFAYTQKSLANVTAGIQLWSGQLDKSVPTKTNAALLAKHLPTTPETHWIENANHFAFLVTPCREAFKREDPEQYRAICTDAEGFNRIAFHKSMHKKMVRFFSEQFDLIE